MSLSGHSSLPCPLPCPDVDGDTQHIPEPAGPRNTGAAQPANPIGNHGWGRAKLLGKSPLAPPPGTDLFSDGVRSGHDDRPIYRGRNCCQVVTLSADTD